MDDDFSSSPAGIGKQKPPRKRRLRDWVGNFAVAFAIVGALVALLIPAVMSAREAARRAQCMCNFCGIVLALRQYHDAYDTLPPAYVAGPDGQPMHSWRVLVLPYLDQALYDQYKLSEPWNGPNNIKLLERMPRTFACPSRHDGESSPTSLTSYVAITGPNTIFPDRGTAKFADVTDKLHNTLIVVEVSNLDIPWTAPQDLELRTMSLRVNDRKRPGISSKHPGGANVSCGDSKCYFMREEISPGNLKALITIAGGEKVTPEEVLLRE
jgi:hypothetical protein